MRRRFEQARGELGRFPHPTHADLAAGLIAGVGAEDPDTAADQGGDVGAGGLIVPHDAVHGRRQHHGRLRGEAERCQEVIGEARRQASHEIRTGRGDEHDLGPARQLDVAHRGFRRRIP